MAIPSADRVITAKAIPACEEKQTMRTFKTNNPVLLQSNLLWNPVN